MKHSPTLSREQQPYLVTHTTFIHHHFVFAPLTIIIVCFSLSLLSTGPIHLVPLLNRLAYRLSVVCTRVTAKRVNLLLLQYIHHTSFRQQEPGWFVLVQLIES